MSARPVLKPAKRGIHLSPGFGADGERYFVGVDSVGKRRFTVVFHGTDDTLPIERALWKLLDTYDPPTRTTLKLYRD